jgi:3-oxoacyl-[acyl-carrier-protein] synthase II
LNIAVTRIAACSALGNSLETTAEALRVGAVGIKTPLDLEQTPEFASGAGEAPLPKHMQGPYRAERALRSTLEDLLRDEDRDSIRTGRERWAIVLGTTLAGMRHCGVGMRAEEKGDAQHADAAFARTSASAVLAHALDGLKFEGPTISVSCACASALSALSHGCSLLRAGIVDAVIAGGYDPISEFAYAGFSALQLVARGPLSPFAEDREGMKLGEGVALFVLRRLEPDLMSAEGEQIRAIITATSESTDAHHLTQPHPEGRGAARAIAEVSRGGPHPQLLVAHATGTPANDSAEYRAYQSTFGVELPRTPVLALKSRFGHPLGAAGALELAAVIRCAELEFVPTTAGRGRSATEFPDLQLREGAVTSESPTDIVALAAGFGGANAALRLTRSHRVPMPEPLSAAPRLGLRIRAAGAVSVAGRGSSALKALSTPQAAGMLWPQFDEEVLAPLLDRARTRRLSLLARLMIAAVRDLVESGNIDTTELRETPLIAANWCGAADFTERYYRDLIRSGIDLANPMLFAESVPNIGSAQCSLAFGIEAPTLSVIGRRTAGIEALWLAEAKIRSQEWRRAIVVAAEEAHPLVERVLTRCVGKPLQLRSGAVALLVEREEFDGGAVTSSFGKLNDISGCTAALDIGRAVEQFNPPDDDAHVLTTDSPFDAALFGTASRVAQVRQRLLSLPEMGAATSLAMLLADPPRDDTVRRIASLDPHGVCWHLLHRSC